VWTPAEVQDATVLLNADCLGDRLLGKANRANIERLDLLQVALGIAEKQVPTTGAAEEVPARWMLKGEFRPRRDTQPNQ
jgi:hypothetical protein